MSKIPVEISRGDPLKPLIALTFDGGGGQSYTKEIVSLLSARQVHATMFLTGSFISRNPEEVKMLADYGHELANHTFSHAWLSEEHTWKTSPGVTKSFFSDEIRKTEEMCIKTSGRPMSKLWRAPYGARNSEVLSWATEMGLPHVFWTYDTADWRTDPDDPLSRPGRAIIEELDLIAQNSPTGLNGYIILLHLGAKRLKDPLLKLLPDFIEQTKRSGYSYGTVTEMIRCSSEELLYGNLPIPTPARIPLPSGIMQIGLSEGYFDDSWIAPFFSVNLTPQAGRKKLHITLMSPDFLVESIPFSVLINEISVCQSEALPGVPIQVPIDIPGDEFRLTIRSRYSFTPFLYGLNQDQRVLSLMLREIS